jgi:SPP1 gp7 family putative phage head morphogenesis protein
MKVKPEALPMKEAREFWADKIRLSPGQFAQLSEEAQLRAFAVSGIAKGQELETVFNALQRSIDEGAAFGDFKKDCKSIFEKRGWTGKRAWRVDNIFRTNVQTAFNVGRYEQMKAAAKLRPYWKYSAVNDSRTRPTHAALNGKIFPHDHPFWDTWYPNNGFRCRCSVISLSERQVKKRGLKVESKDPTGRLIEPIDPKTGNKMLARPLMPDPGFSYHPGKSVYGGFMPHEGLEGYEDISKKTYTDYKRRKLDNLPVKDYGRYTDEDLLEKGLTSSEYASAFLKELGFGRKGGIFTDKIKEPLIISDALFKDVKGDWKIKKAGRERYLRLLARTIREPYEIWLTPQKNKRTGAIILRKRFIKAFSNRSNGKITGFAVFDYHNKAGWEGVTTFMPDRLSYADRARNGILLYKK